MTTTTQAAMTPAGDAKGTQVVAEDFRISDIPKVMTTLTWTQGARIMNRWFNGAPHVMTADEKSGAIPASTLPAALVMTDLPFEWLFTGSTRVTPIVDEIKAQFRYVRDLDQSIGKLPGTLSALSKGLEQLMKRLDKLGAIDLAKGTLKNAYFDFSGKTAIELDETAQFNFRRVGTTLWEQATDDLDDVYGALGGFVIKFAPTRMWTVNEKGFPAKICIEEMGLYVRDTYDFINDEDDQFLGYWSKTAVRQGGALTRGLDKAVRSAEYFDSGDQRFYRVTNDSFNAYRAAFNKGGDFLIFSTVYRFPVDIEITLGKADIEEYKFKQRK